MPVLAEPEYEVEGASPHETMPERYELIDGEVVEVEDRGIYSGVVANVLRDELALHGRTHSLGRAWMEIRFPIPTVLDEGRLRRPDVAFTTYERWPQSLPVPFFGNPAPVVPDLVVEVVSPNDFSDDVIAKTNEYLRAGVRTVWVIHPGPRVLLSFTTDESVRKYSEKDELDGCEVLPGFRFPMASLFPTRAETKP